jgi:TatD DNase family protein
MESLTDTHIHLYAEDFAADLPQLMEAAGAAGINRFFMPNIDRASAEAMLALEKKYPGRCFPMMGLHPCSVKENWKEELAEVENWFAKRSFVAVGEMGIDLYWDKAFVEEQKTVFTRQVEMANAMKLPVVIHTRDSFEVTVALLRKTRKEAPCGIFHCFTGNAEQARAAIDLGFYLGIGGVVTFKNGGVDKTLAEIEMKHLVLETDAPYLAPVPYRGKRNEPAYLLKVAEKIAAIKNCSLETVAKTTSENSRRVFNT